nr:PREDICTED: uncharacterized protein LOC106705466 [Latimeria chalumnae]|eukprot:XP_014350459.1 PREDICTED: uncharacterized protein LOC106705466 [Latimeria chalumnae]
MSLFMPGIAKMSQKQCRQKINVERLKDPIKRDLFHQCLNKKLKNSNQLQQESVSSIWGALKSTIISASVETLGFSTRKRQDWFDENDREIQELINRKCKAFCAWQNDINSKQKKLHHQRTKAEVQRRIRGMKNRWWEDKAKEIQHLADIYNIRGFFSATKATYGPSTQGPNPLRPKDGGDLIKEREAVSARWREHFEDLLNRHSVVDESTLNSIPQHPVTDELGIPPILDEVSKAIKQMKNNKASGADGILAEVFKQGGVELTSHLHNLTLRIWNDEEIPDDLRDAMIVTIFKKGDKSICGNYRGITLLSIAGKIITRTLLNCLHPLAEELLPESQCGFRPSRSTTDMIFTARQLQEKCREQHKPLYMAFFDLTKAFDSVNREALWRILLKYG